MVFSYSIEKTTIGGSYFIGTGTDTKLWIDPRLNGSPLIHQPFRSHPTAVEKFPIGERPAHWIVGSSGRPVGLFGIRIQKGPVLVQSFLPRALNWNSSHTLYVIIFFICISAVDIPEKLT